MTREDYLRHVDYRLDDLPWGMRQNLLAEIRTHLDELPASTDLRAQLGPPEAYAKDLRSAAALERRRGLIAFLRARRPRNLILAVATLIAIGLTIGAIAWIDSYQPLAAGNTTYGPLHAVSSPTGDGNYVVFHQGRRFRYGTTIWNAGRYTVRVLGIPMLGLPISYRLLMSAPTTFDQGGMPPPYTRFRPFDLKPGEQRGIIFAGVYEEPCRDRGPGGGSIDWESIPIRYGFLWRTKTVQVPLPERLAFVFRKSSLCP